LLQIIALRHHLTDLHTDLHRVTAIAVRLHEGVQERGARPLAARR
jgi:hypothetical protein